MNYELKLTCRAEKNIEAFRKSGDKVALKKIDELFDELREHPYSGTGKPEELKGNLSSLWSRRINHKDRLVYQVEDES